MGVQRSLDTRNLLVAGVQAGVPGYSVNLLLFTYWYFSSGHLRFSGRWCPNLNLAKISLSLSRALRIHPENILQLKESHGDVDGKGSAMDGNVTGASVNSLGDHCSSARGSLRPPSAVQRSSQSTSFTPAYVDVYKEPPAIKLEVM